MKDSLCRSMSWMEPDILKQSNRAEWPVMLHNLCYLHAAIRLRARFGQGGWNCPADFANISFRELQVFTKFQHIFDLFFFIIFLVSASNINIKEVQYSAYLHK